MNFKSFIKCTEVHPSYEYGSGLIEDGYDRDFYEKNTEFRAIGKIKEGGKTIGYNYKCYQPTCAEKVASFSVSSISSFSMFHQFLYTGTKLKFINDNGHKFKDKFFKEDFFQFKKMLEEKDEFNDFIFLTDGLCEDSSYDEYENEYKASKPPLPLPMAIRYSGILMIEGSYDVNLQYARIKMSDGSTLKCLEDVEKVLLLIGDRIHDKKMELRAKKKKEKEKEQYVLC